MIRPTIKYIPFFLITLVLSGFLQAQEQKKGRPKKIENATNQPKVASEDITIEGVKSKFLIKDSSSVVIFMRIDLSKPNNASIRWQEMTTKFTLNYVLYPDFSSRERLGYGNIPLTEQNTTQLSATRYIVRYEVKKPSNYNNAVMLAELSEIGTTKKILNDLAIRFRSDKLSDRFALFEPTGRIPLLQNYININEKFILQDINQTTLPLFVTRYRHDFEAAASPMNTSPRSTARTLEVDSTFMLNTSVQVSIKEEGLYFMSQDTIEASGIGLLVVGRRFPKMTLPAELVRPVMYMSQSQEINELLSSKDPKKSLDKYWLTLMNGNTDLAKRSISVFYRRVEEANRLFTTYKEGWKTDKGMIFIIMGSPDRVQRSKDREVWVYGQRANFSEINFTFNRRPNQFVEDHYELQRYVEYQPIWYPIVEAWRTGAVRD
ncbi:MAG: GWxTD domain-containing protein [Runella sp.]